MPEFGISFWEAFSELDGLYEETIKLDEAESQERLLGELRHMIDSYYDVTIPMHAFYERYIPVAATLDRSSPANITVVGYPAEHFIESLLSYYEHANVTIILPLKAMIDSVVSSLPEWINQNQLHFEQSSLADLALSEEQDLIISSLSLSTFSSDARLQLLKHYHKALSERGQLMILDVIAKESEALNAYYGALHQQWCDYYYHEDTVVSSAAKGFIQGLVTDTQLLSELSSAGFPLARVENHFMTSGLISSAKTTVEISIVKS